MSDHFFQQKKIQEISLRDVNTYLLSLWKENKNRAIQNLRKDRDLLSENVKLKFHQASLEEIGIFYNRVRRISNDMLNVFIKNSKKTLFDSFIEKAENSTPIQVTKFLIRLDKASKNTSKELITTYLKQIFKILGKELASYSLKDIKPIIKLLGTVSEEFVIEFLHIHEKNFYEMLEDRIRAHPLRRIPFITLKYVPKQIALTQQYKDLIIKFVDEKLDSSPLHEIGQFFGDLARYFDSMARELLKTRQLQLSKIFEEKISHASLREAAVFFKSLDFSPIYLKEIIEPHQLALLELIKKSSLKEIEDFLDWGRIERNVIQNFIKNYEEEFIAIVKEKFGQPSQDITEYLSQMEKYSESLGKMITKSHEKTLVSVVESDFTTSTLGDIGQLLHLAEESEKLTNEILQGRRKLLENKLNSSTLKEIWQFLSKFYKSSIRSRSSQCIIVKAKRFVKLYKTPIFEAVQHKIQQAPLRDIGEFLKHLLRISRFLAREFVVLNKPKLFEIFGEKIKESSLYDIHTFLRNLALVSPDSVKGIIRDFYSNIFALTQDLFQKSLLEDIYHFLEAVSIGSEELANEIIQAHKKSLIDERYRRYLISRLKKLLGLSFLLFEIPFRSGKISNEVTQVFAQMLHTVIKEEVLDHPQEFSDWDLVFHLITLKFSPEALKQEFIQAYNERIFNSLEKLLQKSSLPLFSSLLSSLTSLSEIKTKEFIQSHKNQLLSLANEKFKDLSFRVIYNFLSVIAVTSEPFAVTLLQDHSNLLKEKFSNSSPNDLFSIFFRHRFSEKLDTFLIQISRTVLLEYGDKLLMGPIWQSTHFISRLKEISEDTFRNFVQIHQNLLSKLIKKNITEERLDKVGEFLLILGPLVIKIIELNKEFITEIVGKRIPDVTLHELGKFLIGLSFTSKEYANEMIELYEEVFCQLLKDRLLYAELKGIGAFLQGIATVSQRSAKIMFQMSEVKLLDNLEEKLWDASLQGIQEFFSGFFTVSEDFGRNIIGSAKSLFPILREKFREENIFQVGNFFLGIYNISEALAQEFLFKLDESIKEKLHHSSVRERNVFNSFIENKSCWLANKFAQLD